MPACGRKYRRVGLGGTFDKLHKGHIRLVEKALEIGELVIIGLATIRMLKKDSKPHVVANYDERKKELITLLRREGVLNRVQIVPINDAYGTSLSDGEIEAIVVSRETAGRTGEINRLREERGLKPLGIIVIDMVLAEDSVPISTTRIRKKEIDREGHLL